jgi:hypothetical protein
MFCLPISTFMFLLAIYIFPGLTCLFCCSQIGRPILEIYKLLIDIHECRNWERGRAVSFLGFSVQCIYCTSWKSRERGEDVKGEKCTKMVYISGNMCNKTECENSLHKLWRRLICRREQKESMSDNPCSMTCMVLMVFWVKIQYIHQYLKLTTVRSWVTPACDQYWSMLSSSYPPLEATMAGRNHHGRGK